MFNFPVVILTLVLAFGSCYTCRWISSWRGVWLFRATRTQNTSKRFWKVIGAINGDPLKQTKVGATVAVTLTPVTKSAMPHLLTPSPTGNRYVAISCAILLKTIVCTIVKIHAVYFLEQLKANRINKHTWQSKSKERKNVPLFVKMKNSLSWDWQKDMEFDGRDDVRRPLELYMGKEMWYDAERHYRLELDFPCTKKIAEILKMLSATIPSKKCIMIPCPYTGAVAVHCIPIGQCDHRISWSRYPHRSYRDWLAVLKNCHQNCFPKVDAWA